MFRCCPCRNISLSSDIITHTLLFLCTFLLSSSVLKNKMIHSLVLSMDIKFLLLFLLSMCTQTQKRKKPSFFFFFWVQILTISKALNKTPSICKLLLLFYKRFLGLAFCSDTKETSGTSKFK